MPEKGTAEWFEKVRRRCIDHLRALLSIQLAHRSIQEILRRWGSIPPTVGAALHSNCVVAYSRPFTSAMTKHGKIRYPIKGIQSESGFDKELHVHIMDLRDRMIAHSDYDVFPSTMFLQAIGDEKLPISLGLNVKGIMGIKTRDLAERYEKHISSCATAIENALNRECNQLAEVARLYPAEFDKTHNLPANVQKVETKGTHPTLLKPSGPAADVAEPSFPEGMSGYQYLMLSHEVALIESGKHIVNINGVATEVDIITEGGQKKTQ
jgi:hypothetical protein